jgi:acetate kinase
MGVAGSLSLIANPGSASRKYALYEGISERATIHFEWVQDKISCALRVDGERQTIEVSVSSLTECAGHVAGILREAHVLGENEHISQIGIRVVAPSAYFLNDHTVDDEFIARLEAIEPRAPIHVTATLQELYVLREQFAGARVLGASDSAFHISKPDYAWNYGLPLDIADKYEIKRYGYHGLSLSSVVRQLEIADRLPSKLIVCHLGSGASVTAVQDGKSVDTTMGYSPLEGLIMSTRSGSIDPTAVRVLKDVCNLDDDGLEQYLNTNSGLLGIGGSSDIRELLSREFGGDGRARLALATYVHNVQKAIGQMSAVLGGVDMIVFAGTVGERSAPMRKRIVSKLRYLDFVLDEQVNDTCNIDDKMIAISHESHLPIYIVAIKEADEIAHHLTLNA